MDWRRMILSWPRRGQMSVETNDNNNMRPRRGRTLPRIIAANDMRSLRDRGGRLDMQDNQLSDNGINRFEYVFSDQKISKSGWD